MPRIFSTALGSGSTDTTACRDIGGQVGALIKQGLVTTEGSSQGGFTGWMLGPMSRMTLVMPLGEAGVGGVQTRKEDQHPQAAPGTSHAAERVTLFFT